MKPPRSGLGIFFTAAVSLLLFGGAACNERDRAGGPPTATAPAAPATGAPSNPVDGPSTSIALDAGTTPTAAAGGGRSAAREGASCPATPWASYGHDPARTSASDGCVDGPLAVTWKLTRKGGCGFRSRAGRILHVIAEENAIFAAVDCGSSPAVMRVTTAGEALWTFSRGDFGRGSWPAFAGDAILSTDDGVFLVDRETGKLHGRELDVWGEPIVVGDAYFVDNTFQLDGSGPFVGAFDATLHWTWQRSVINPGKGKSVPRTGGIAYADGTIVHAAAMGGHVVPSLAAHDAKSGDRKWLAAGTWPESSPSIADGRVFTVERWKGEKADRLVARSLADGSAQWSETIPWARGPAPVIADKLVIVHGAEGVRAHDRRTGALVWSSPLPRKAEFNEPSTTLAVAKGTHTLVVTSGVKLVVLELEHGTEKWSGAVATGWSDTSPGGTTIERPVIVGRTVYVTSDGTLIRLDPTRAP